MADLNVAVKIIGQDLASGPIGKVEQSLSGLGKVAATASLAVAGAAAAIGGVSVKAAIDFESAFAGVRKTVDATEEEFADFRQGIRDMAKTLPASREQIAGVAEAAGQLGIRKDALLGFTRTMIDLGEATNLTAQDAATQLARLANITRMPQESFDRLGATVVALGNNLATTEAEIVTMGLRLAGAGAQVGLTEDQILSFAGALSSVGIEAEAGGTAFSRVMINMANEVKSNGELLDDFAVVAGMSASQFKTAFEEDASGAVLAFVEGLGKISEQGGNVFATLEGLELGEIRVRDALLRASGAGDLFRNSLEVGSKAWQENSALTNEAAQRYQTTASQLAILRNRVTDVALTLGDALLPHLNTVIQRMTPLIEQFGQWFPQAIRDAEGAIRPLVSFFQGNMLPVIERLTDWLRGRLGEAISWLSGTAWPWLQRAASDATTFFESTVLPVLSRVRDWLNDRVGAALEWLSETAWPALKKAAGEVSGFFQSEVVPRLTELRNWLEQQLGAALQWLTETAWPGLRQAAGEVSRFFQSEVIPRVQELSDRLDQQLRQAVSWMKDTGFPGLQAAAGDLTTSLQGLAETLAAANEEAAKRGAYENLQEAWQSIQRIGGLLVETVQQIIGTFTDSVQPSEDAAGGVNFLAGGFVNLTSNIRDGIAALETVIGLIPRAIQLSREFRASSPFHTPLGQHIQSGLDMAAGLARGLQGGQAEVRSAGADVGNAALQGARQAVRAESPSRKFMELGEDMGTGLIMGWLGTGGDLQKAVSEQMGLTHKDAKAATQDMARDIASALDTAANAYFDFQRDVERLNKQIAFDLVRVGEQMGEDINQAVLKADRDIQAALRDFDRSLADMARQRELDANIAQRRGALESELRPQEQGIRERFEARRREFQASRSLKELEHQLTKDLAEADTEEEKKQAQARFDEAKAELARDQGLAAEEREFMRRLAEEEVAELAGIEQRRVDFENTLREEAHLRDIARVHQQRDERVTAINDALAQEQAAIISAAEAETKKLKEQHELRVKDLQEQVVDKIPDLTGQADETITAFLEGIEKNIGGMAAQAIADAGRAQTAIAAVITAAQNAQQAISNIGSPAATFNMGVALAGSRQHGGHVAAGNAYLVGEAGPELLTMGNTSGHVTPNHRLGGGIDYDRLAAAMLRAMQGMAVEMDGERVGRLVAPHIAPANARSIAL